jgi:hypothetical protein
MKSRQRIPCDLRGAFRADFAGGGLPAYSRKMPVLSPVEGRFLAATASSDFYRCVLLMLKKVKPQVSPLLWDNAVKLSPARHSGMDCSPLPWGSSFGLACGCPKPFPTVLCRNPGATDGIGLDHIPVSWMPASQSQTVALVATLPCRHDG